MMIINRYINMYVHSNSRVDRVDLLERGGVENVNGIAEVRQYHEHDEHYDVMGDCGHI